LSLSGINYFNFIVAEFIKINNEIIFTFYITSPAGIQWL